jgi:hypothetical protein
VGPVISDSARQSLVLPIFWKLRLVRQEVALIRRLLVCTSLTSAFLAALLMQPRPSSSASFAPPPRSIVICGAQDYACATYLISYQPATHAHRGLQGKGVIDYERKTISIVWSTDRFKNVEALEREVFHAALWERGIRDTDKREVDDWIYFSGGTFALLFRENPEFVRYLTAGY